MPWGAYGLSSADTWCQRQQFPVKDLEVGGGALRGDRRRQARQKGERATVNSLKTVAWGAGLRRASRAMSQRGGWVGAPPPDARPQRAQGVAGAAPRGRAPIWPVGSVGLRSRAGSVFLQIHEQQLGPALDYHHVQRRAQRRPQLAARLLRPAPLIESIPQLHDHMGHIG
jgi:hypothetical protein